MLCTMAVECTASRAVPYTCRRCFPELADEGRLTIDLRSEERGSASRSSHQSSISSRVSPLFVKQLTENVTCYRVRARRAASTRRAFPSRHPPIERRRNASRCSSGSSMSLTHTLTED
jgi:hypothetical protein